jgi:tetratricopeptide (TPR) repeat protein
MKTKKKKNKNLMSVYFLAGILCLSFSFLSCIGQKTDNVVQQAYDLRISGHADSAIAILNVALESNPENAAAWYELARAKHHALMAGQKYEISEIIANASEASVLEPGNVIYAYYEGIVKFLDVYMNMMRGNEDVKEKMLASNEAFEKALKVDACYAPALITLIEINAMLPPEMGGDYQKAENFVAQLDECSPVNGLKGQVFLLPEDASLVKFWEDAYKANPDEATVAEELGRAWLLEGDVANGKLFIEEAVSLDPDKSSALIDLGRATGMSIMRDPENKQSLAINAIAAFQQYLDMNPDAPGSIKAYTYNMMAKVSKMSGDESKAEEYRAKSAKLDPFRSRASGSPPEYLFVAPDVIPENITYFSRPF